ncbi:hypothetical protein VFPPC_15972 [Pochonia chlamydosporia 170]|uniref:Uncharacterized protein n=1 Tax=Pochonia chlamydosporia 170 TaxID=1380566 RepID=A0A179FKD8_METCM|nr:hypothetical protein VFPPC_15972 [Pochonia chlamydosporia 170]OAQ66014.1 hypothetical protein VFPPC_15972 [Pochonia chlamydosporia 170]
MWIILPFLKLHGQEAFRLMLVAWRASSLSHIHCTLRFAELLSIPSHISSDPFVPGASLLVVVFKRRRGGA